MTKQYIDHHHYKGDDLTRSEKVERKAVELILDSALSDSERENSRVWELKHSAGCIQLARILAQNRGLDMEMAEVIAALHDIYAIVKGKYKEHAVLGAKIAAEILDELGGFGTQEIELICNAIRQHSDKQVYSGDPYAELIKDVDVFDCSLYKNAEGYYGLHKPPEVLAEYQNRIRKVRQELGLPPMPLFRE